jgi:hypothetical protein
MSYSARGWGAQDVAGKHLVKVEPLNAILDPEYFVRAVHECVMNVRRWQGRRKGSFRSVGAAQ